MDTLYVPIQVECSLQYMPAFHKQGTRPISSIKWVVLHSEEAGTAESAARYFRSENAGGSAHLCVDDNICYRCLRNTDIPWGAASAFGANTYGFHIEMAGFAKWQAATWMLHTRTLKRAAYKTALHLKKFNLPIQFVDAAGLVAGRKGVTTHLEVSRASKKIDPSHSYRYSHWDPGYFFPRKYFMKLVRQYCQELKYNG